MNLAASLGSSLPSSLWEFLLRTGEIAQDRGWPLYLVGGMVRDLLLGRPSLDLDLVVEGDAIALAQSLTAKAVIHRRFGTAKLRWQQWSLDIASSRGEDYPRPGALPRVRPGDIHQDLGRRDFTINAMAIPLSPPSLGQLLDPYQGREDLHQGLIRILHPNSFVDDATRIFRALRYEQRFGFKLEEATQRLLVRDIPYLDAISGDRLRHEIELIFREQSPERVLARAGELGVLQHLSADLGGNGWLRERLMLARGLSPTISLCLFFYPLPGAEGDRLITRLNYPKATGHILRQSLLLKDELAQVANWLPGLKPSQLYFMLRSYPPTAIQANALATASPQVRQKLELYLHHLCYVKLALTGEELIKLGVPSGPQVGTLLERLLLARLDGAVGSRQEETGLVRRWLEGQSPGH